MGGKNDSWACHSWKSWSTLLLWKASPANLWDTNTSIYWHLINIGRLSLSANSRFSACACLNYSHVQITHFLLYFFFLFYFLSFFLPLTFCLCLLLSFSLSVFILSSRKQQQSKKQTICLQKQQIVSAL